MVNYAGFQVYKDTVDSHRARNCDTSSLGRSAGSHPCLRALLKQDI